MSKRMPLPSLMSRTAAYPTWIKKKGSTSHQLDLKTMKNSMLTTAFLAWQLNPNLPPSLSPSLVYRLRVA